MSGCALVGRLGSVAETALVERPSAVRIVAHRPGECDSLRVLCACQVLVGRPLKMVVPDAPERGVEHDPLEAVIGLDRLLGGRL